MKKGRSDKLVTLFMALQRVLDGKPLQYASVLAFVSNRPGISYHDLVLLTDTSKSAVASIVAWYVEQGYMQSFEAPTIGGTRPPS